MLEKGLSMRPRRPAFAASYINEVLDMALNAQRTGCMSPVELAWVNDVLSDYFAATEASTDSNISSARLRWRANWLPNAPQPGASSPRPFGVATAPVDANALLALAQHRKSVRWFLHDPVPGSVVAQAVATAQTAPSACNRQPYRFLVIQDEAEAQAVAACAGGTAGYLHNIRHLVVVVGDLSAFSHPRDRHVIYVDSSLASMNLILSLEAQGVGSCCINWPDAPDRDRGIRRLIDIAPHEQVVMLIAFGYADPTGYVPFSQRKELSSALSRHLGGGS
jgi:nitroreductase